jgi:general secretion pathway protein C
MLTRWCTFLLWALVAGSASFWGLRLAVQGTPAPAHAGLATGQGAVRGDLSRLLGADAVAVVQEPVAVADPRFQLLGVLSAPRPRAEQEGVALIVVDDRPPRAFRVGMVVDGDTVLQSVNARGANLGPRGGLVQVALELPLPAPAATGTLPAAAQPVFAPTRGAAPGAPPGTQIFMPQGQPAPSFTRNGASEGAYPTAASQLPAPPPEMAMPVYSTEVPTEPAQDAEEQANPLR